MEKAFPGTAPDAAALDVFLDGLHLEDLALAAACEDGHEAAWEHFVREFRPQLYRAATAIDPSGGARELADSLYGELFGLSDRDGERRSLFRYFHGRSRLSTWLRSVLAQRRIDAVRSLRKVEPLEDEHVSHASSGPAVDMETAHCGDVVGRALSAAIAALADRDRLRLSCYYAQHLTLAQIGRMTGEHEATVSRQLTRTRATVRHAVERALIQVDEMSSAAIEECVKALAADPGALDVVELLGLGGERKNAPPARSR
jgi:RNA polymerase sigma-70 factor (ECF subfamily)